MHSFCMCIRVCQCEKALVFFMEENINKKKRRLRIPLWAKTLVVLLLSVISISVVAVVYASNKLRSITEDHYINKSVELADTLALYLDLDDVKQIKKEVIDDIYEKYKDEGVPNEEWEDPRYEPYMAHFEPILTSPTYLKLMETINKFHRINDAKWTYLAYADFELNRLVYLVDDEPNEDDRCLPGSFDNFTPQDLTVINHLDTGFEPEITNMEQYGYVCSSGRPIYDPNDGSDMPVAFAMVDISMANIVSEENADIRTLTIILIALGVAVTTIGYLLVLLLIIRPVRILTKTANQYTDGNDKSLHKFSKVKINTKDEIEDLANSMKKMEEDINHYIADLFSTTTKLQGAERKAVELKILADRDALTGLMNKRAYFEKEENLNVEIKKGEAKFAVCMIDLNDLKLTNDTYGHEKGDILINAVSNIIRRVFALSYCYRIGGDEFVVIAENEDYRNIKKLEKLFSTVIEQTKEDEIQVSAAIGVAKFDPSIDNNVEDVFKRADKLMYENKKRMKE